MRPWVGGGRASERSTDDVVSAAAAAQGMSPPSRSFQILDFPHLGTLTSDGVKFEKRAIREMRDAELDAWLIDRSLEPLRAGLSRIEREMMAFRVRKLPCDDDEEPSPRTAAQGRGAKRLPQKMPQKTVEERAEEVAFSKMLDNDIMRQMRITDPNDRAKYLVDVAAGDIAKYSPISGVAERERRGGGDPLRIPTVAREK